VQIVLHYYGLRVEYRIDQGLFSKNYRPKRYLQI